MRKIGIIMFNSALKTDKTKNSDLIKEIKLEVEINGKSFKNNSLEELTKEVDKVKVIPKTSQPSTGDLINSYNDWLEKFEHIIVLTPDKGLSGTHQNAVLAKSMLETRQENMHIVETKSFAISELYMAEKTIDLINEGKEIDEILNILKDEPDKFETYIIPGNFEYLKMSGRVNVAQLLIGKIMTLKLLIKHKDGHAEVIKKERGFKKILRDIDQIISASPNIKQIYIGHLSPDPKEIKMLEDLMNTYENIEKKIAQYPSVILTAHFGPKTVGFMTINQ